MAETQNSEGQASQTSQGQNANAGGQPGDFDLSKLSPQDQKLFDIAYRKGAEKKEGETDALRKQLATNQTLMETFQATANLSEQEKEQLRAEVMKIKTATQTKEQTLQEQMNALKTESKTQIDGLTEDRDFWKGTHIDHLIRLELAQAAAEAGAFNTQQVVRMLYEDAVPVEEKDEVTKEFKGYHIEVRVPVQEGEKQVMKSLPAKDAVREFLKFNPNLLRSQVAGPGTGTGGAAAYRTPAGIVTKADIDNPENYKTPEGRQKMLDAIIRGEVL